MEKQLKVETESCEGRWALRPLRPPLLPRSLGVGFGLGTERQSLQVWEGSVLTLSLLRMELLWALS